MLYPVCIRENERTNERTNQRMSKCDSVFSIKDYTENQRIPNEYISI